MDRLKKIKTCSADVHIVLCGDGNVTYTSSWFSRILFPLLTFLIILFSCKRNFKDQCVTPEGFIIFGPLRLRIMTNCSKSDDIAYLRHFPVYLRV